ncbi:hypothetical protein ACQKLX_27795 [Bosea sp. NPDC003192]|uniref:hypothetical protein n=1 Tax=Bosea sp. NPDC003192 TaxID=3390551 RepID=UPI003D007858
MIRPRPLLAKPEFLSSEEASVVDRINKGLLRVAAARSEKVKGADYLASKLAWKVKTYQNGLLYRTVSLFDGCVAAMGASSPVVAMLASRALLETVALLGELLLKTRKALQQRDFEAFGAWLFQRIFATRDEAMLAQYGEIPSTRAVNIVTILSGFESKYPDVSGLREIYDQLSEFCHPNSMGHHFLFGNLDTQNHTMSYDDVQDKESTFALILTALCVIEFVEDWLLEFDQHVSALKEVG